jgi:hypothetical protein
VNNLPRVRSAITRWKQATQARTDRRRHGPKVEILNLVDGHPGLKDHDHRNCRLASRRHHGCDGNLKRREGSMVLCELTKT